MHDLHMLSEPAGETDSVLHPERPLLLVVEGIDLSGRTTQVKLLHDWLLAQHYAVTTTAWRTSPLVSDLLARARSSRSHLQPMAYSLLFCADHLDRTEHIIKPALARREVVLADRYSYTAFARDAARGVDPAWIRDVYSFVVKPDEVFYLHISPEEAVKRRMALMRKQKDAHAVLSSKASKHASSETSSKAEAEKKHGKKADKASEKGAKQVKKHAPAVAELKETIPDLRAESVPLAPISQETLESFRSFEDRMYIEYQRMQKEFGFTVIEGSQSIETIQNQLRQRVMRLLLNL